MKKLLFTILLLILFIHISVRAEYCEYYQPIEYNIERTNNTMIYKYYKITGPYTDNLDVIDKITTLNTSLNSFNYRFMSFDNCHLNDNLESVCEGNTYYAKYAEEIEEAV